MYAKRTGLREYGIIASRYVSEFDRKWVRGGAADDEQLIGSGDIQSLADLGNSFQVIRDMLPFPFRIKDTVIELVVITLIPVLPLVLTMIPLEELITKLFGAFSTPGIMQLNVPGWRDLNAPVPGLPLHATAAPASSKKKQKR